ncbi:MAG: site-specific DNA-methyltransferase [Candidatus Moranbacteria bacterium]|nr:site-specific DNA-methyltransferase [Candidatus Moranbacteria bacterium]
MDKINLTENEIRDIIKYLESGKPLPEKFRFLLFADKKEVELVWNGKTSEVSNVVLPFQTIEVVDEPRAENTQDTKKQVQQMLFDFDDRGRQIAGWTNKLIWGDNKLILSSLKSGVLREEIEKAGGLKLIYIDPPFDVGADFSMKVEIGDDELTKKPNVLEELAYRDTWGKGADSFIAMIYERLSLMKDLLADDGSIYVHCDYRVNSYMRLILDEIFGHNNFISEIIWKRTGARAQSNFINPVHDLIYFYAKDINRVKWNSYITPYSQEYIDKYYRHTDKDGRKFQDTSLIAPGKGYQFEWKGVTKGWRHNKQKFEKLENEDRIYYTKEGVARYKRYLDEMEGIPPQDIWSDISNVNSQSSERLDYPTQKPEAIIERIINASSDEGDLVADLFCGSGTTLAVAEKLGRKWIGSDLGKFSIHTTRKRMIGVQREMKKSGTDFRAFEILNLGKYERQHYIGVNPDLREEQKQKQLAKKEKDFVKLIVKAYKAEAVNNFKTFVAKKAGRLVAIGPINLPASRLFVEEIIKECIEKQITKVDILSFEYEMGLFPKIQEEAKAKGIDLALKNIPREVFDKRAIEKNQIQFHDVSYIEVKPHIKPAGKRTPGAVAIELTDFSVYYNQDIVDNVIASLKKGANKILVEQGNIIKISKDKDGIVKREVLTKKWTDWIDYWAVDFNFESKKEIVRIKKEDGEIEEVWSGNYIFENEWQSFRTKKDRSIELKSVSHECEKGRRKIAVKVVDIFGNDTMKVIEVNI